MVRRPGKLARTVRGTLSVLGGILVEMFFVFWFVIIVCGTALVALILWQRLM